MEQHTVLVVEDEMFIRDDVTEHLKDCGFVVLQAVNADEAVEMILAHPDIDLVFTDVRMPGTMDGLQLAGWVLEQRPNIPVIIASGDIGRAAAIRELCGAHHSFIKPYNLDELAGKMRLAIHSRKMASGGPRLILLFGHSANAATFAGSGTPTARQFVGPAMSPPLAASAKNSVPQTAPFSSIISMR